MKGSSAAGVQISCKALDTEGSTNIASATRQLAIKLPDRTLVIDICSEELVLDLRHVIAELYPSCFYTDYQLLSKGRRLNDFEELKTLLESLSQQATESEAQPVLVLEPLAYDERSLRQHIDRFRALLESPSVPLLRSDRKDCSDAAGVPSTSPVSSEVPSSRVPETPNGRSSKTKRSDKKKHQSKKAKSVPSDCVDGQELHPAAALPFFLESSPVAEHEPLFDPHFPSSCFKEATLPDTNFIRRIVEPEPGLKKKPCLRYIKSLAYNPPPRTARLRGDLWYVEIGTLEGTLVDVVATENGFCVLSIRAPEQPCNAYPATFGERLWKRFSDESVNCRYFWTLHDLLSTVSQKYVEGVEALLIDAAHVDPELPYKLLSPFRPFRAWVKQSDIPELDVEHDTGKLEESLEHPLGVNVWESQREWNEEFQLLVKQPSCVAVEDPCQGVSATSCLSTSPSAECSQDPLSLVNLNQERNSVKVLGDIAAVCVKAGMNARDNRITPLMTNDEPAVMEEKPDIQIYSWNNLFLLQNWSPSSLSQLEDPLPNLESRYNDILSNTPVEFCSRKGIQTDCRTVQLVASLLRPALPFPTTRYTSKTQAPEPLNTTNNAFSSSKEAARVTPSTAPCSPSEPSHQHSSLTLLETSQLAEVGAGDNINDATGQLSVLSSLVVDYAGARFFTQAVMPGLLCVGESSAAAQPLFGVVTPNAPYYQAPAVVTALNEHLSKPLGFLPHTVVHHYLPETGSPVACSLQTSVPFETKVLEGADGRSYITDAGRMLPMDLNWFSDDEIRALETGVAASGSMAETIKAKSCVRIVRPELLNAYLWSRDNIVSAYSVAVDNSSKIKSSTKDREYRAKARLEWLRSMGLHHCPELVAHAVVPASRNNASFPVDTAMDLLWPGWDYLMGGSTLRWDYVKRRQEGIAQFLASRLEYMATAQLPKEKNETLDQTTAAGFREQRWSSILGPGWQLLSQWLPELSDVPIRLNKSSPSKNAENATDDAVSFCEKVKSVITDYLMIPQKALPLPTVSDAAVSKSPRIPGLNSSSVGLQHEVAVKADGSSLTAKAKGSSARFSVNTQNADQRDGLTRSLPCAPPALFNPNLALFDTMKATPKEREICVAELRMLAWYVRDVALQRLTDHLAANAFGVCVESSELALLFHAFGVNMRYLGVVVARLNEQQQEKDSEHSSFIVECLERDILCRCMAYFVNTIMSQFPVGALGSVAAHLLNLVFAAPGTSFDYSSTLTQNQKQSDLAHSWLDLSSDTFWDRLHRRALAYFRYPGLLRLRNLLYENQECRYVLLRTLCRKTGLQISPAAVARVLKLHGVSSDPLVSSTTTKGEGAEENKSLGALFLADDIVDIVPILKSDIYSPAIVRDVFIAGVIAQSLDLLGGAFECYQSAVQLLHQLNISLTRECCWAQSGTAFVLVMAGDVANAVLHLRRVALLTEQTLGLDHPHLIDAYAMLSKLYYALIYTLSKDGLASTTPYNAGTVLSESSSPVDAELKLLSLSEKALCKAITLTLLWGGSSYRNISLAPLLTHGAKLLTYRSGLAARYQQNNYLSRVQLAVAGCLLESSEQSRSTMGVNLPLRLLSLLEVVERIMVKAEHIFSNDHLFLRAQIDGELASQFCSAGEPRRALAAVRRQRSALEQLLGSQHPDIAALDAEVAELAKQAVRRAKQDKATATQLNFLLQQALQRQTNVA